MPRGIVFIFTYLDAFFLDEFGEKMEKSPGTKLTGDATRGFGNLLSEALAVFLPAQRPRLRSYPPGGEFAATAMCRPDVSGRP